MNKYQGNEKIKDWDTHLRYTSANPYIKSKTDLNLLTDKGVYPYDYMNSWDKLDETQLPKKEDFKEINAYMDFSDYNVEHPNFDKTNKKVLGKFQDEMNGERITHFIGLKPKAYCYKVYGDEKEHKKSKGVVKHKVSADAFNVRPKKQ